MKRQELVFRELARGHIQGRNTFTQLELSKTLGMSLGTVNKAVKNLEEINAVRISRRALEVSDFTRLMMYWATHRNLKRDVVYETRAGISAREMERSMPQGTAFTAYTAYMRIFGEAPADYSEVYVYATKEAGEEIKERFPGREGFSNLIVLAADEKLEKDIANKKLERGSVCAPQAYVDLWNIDAWYAKDFSDALAKRLGI